MKNNKMKAGSIRRAALLSASLLSVFLAGCDTVDSWFGKTPDPPLPVDDEGRGNGVRRHVAEGERDLSRLVEQARVGDLEAADERPRVLLAVLDVDPDELHARGLG